MDLQKVENDPKDLKKFQKNYKPIFSKFEQYLHNYTKITSSGCKTGPKNPIRPLKLIVQQRINGVWA